MAITLDGTLGITTPGLTNTGTETLVNLTTTGNTTLGDASTDTLNVGNGGLIKDASGNVGVGVTPSAWRNLFNVVQSGQSSAFVGQTNSNTTYVASNWYSTSGGTDTRIAAGYASQYYQDSGQHVWRTAGTSTAGSSISFTQAMTLDASGNLAVGMTTPTGDANRIVSIAAAGGSGFFMYDTNQGSTVNDGANIQVAGTNLYIYNKEAGFVAFGQNNTERARIDSSGNLLVGGTSLDIQSNMLYWNRGGGTAGHLALGNTEATAAVAVIYLNRQGSDGTLVEFRQANTTEGSISVSGTTVSYNGGHLSRYAQTIAVKDETILKGTVLSNLDEMNVYTKDGQPVANEQLNKVKVSDTEGDANVAGVFVNWTHDDQHDVDEINMAMTGDMIIRIAQGVTVARGDLLMSAGDGTAKSQGDDIVRSKTVAKVTSNHVTCTYEDGSYCVPCVLMAC